MRDTGACWASTWPRFHAVVVSLTAVRLSTRLAVFRCHRLPHAPSGSHHACICTFAYQCWHVLRSRFHGCLQACLPFMAHAAQFCSVLLDVHAGSVFWEVSCNTAVSDRVICSSTHSCNFCSARRRPSVSCRRRPAPPTSSVALITLIQSSCRSASCSAHPRVHPGTTCMFGVAVCTFLTERAPNHPRLILTFTAAVALAFRSVRSIWVLLHISPATGYFSTGGPLPPSVASWRTCGATAVVACRRASVFSVMRVLASAFF